MHQAAVVASGAGLSSRIQNSRRLLCEHGAGYICILYREGSAESATLFHMVDLNQIDSLYRLQQSLWAIAKAKISQSVAAGMVGNTVWIVGPHIFKLKTLR